MYILRIEHSVLIIEKYRESFDRDPVGRQMACIPHYEISQPGDNPNTAVIDLGFDNKGQTESLLASLKLIWRNME
jgi:hypothetical protein